MSIIFRGNQYSMSVMPFNRLTDHSIPFYVAKVQNNMRTDKNNL